MAAVQPRYSSHRQSRLFHDACRGGAAPMEPHKEMVPPPQEQQQHPPLFLDFSHGDGDGSNGRKRLRETVTPPLPRLLSLQTPQDSPGHKLVCLAQLHRRPATTGLRLGFDHGGSACTSSSLLLDEVAAQFDDHYRNEMDRLIQEHAERLRRALTDTRRRHSRSLLGAAEALASRRVREKEAEASMEAQRGAELEERLARLRAEAAAWQAKAMSGQSTAAALHAQLQQAQRRSGGRRRVRLHRSGQGGGGGQALPRVPATSGLHRAAPVQAPLRMRCVRARRVGLRSLSHVPLPGHRQRASLLLLTVDAYRKRNYF